MCGLAAAAADGLRGWRLEGEVPVRPQVVHEVGRARVDDGRRGDAHARPSEVKLAAGQWEEIKRVAGQRKVACIARVQGRQASHPR